MHVRVLLSRVVVGWFLKPSCCGDWKGHKSKFPFSSFCSDTRGNYRPEQAIFEILQPLKIKHWKFWIKMTAISLCQYTDSGILQIGTKNFLAKRFTWKLWIFLESLIPHRCQVEAFLEITRLTGSVNDQLQNTSKTQKIWSYFITIHILTPPGWHARSSGSEIGSISHLQYSSDLAPSDFFLHEIITSLGSNMTTSMTTRMTLATFFDSQPSELIREGM